MDFQNNSHTHQTESSANVSLFTMDDSVMCMGDDMPDDEIVAKNQNNNNNNTTNSASTLLRQQVMLNQFGSITGCSQEQSLHFLLTSNWQYQVKNQECILNAA